MATKVGSKGQVVIEKGIRDKLGVGPGWLALQRVVDGHVEITFLPPEHNRSLYGSLGQHTTIRIPLTEVAWDEAREQAREARANEWKERQRVTE